ncbi:hypothetical protein [Pinirhizobacter soli]|uniref:hypothetical protein n=1 Tax=Pinirhizobacter soli TaxID=2786953 RepID=UPI002029C5EA|nr:hypothetical protein [Pinirhizobacter soli]
MTGFLGRLAARIVGPAPMLGPRQPSMFEGARFADSVSDPAHGGLLAAVEAPSIGDAAIAAAFPRKFDPVPPAGEAERVRDRRSRRGRLPAIEPPDGVSPVAPADPAPTAASAVDDHPRIFPRTSVVVETDVAARRFAASDETFRHGTLTARASLYPAQPGNASSPRVAGTPGVSLASAEPVVHVSIGRIELRAQAPSKPIRHHHTPQGTSLDDYLRQRGDRARP